jgi:TolB-like protein/Flp pilus assembly protein TadD
MAARGYNDNAERVLMGNFVSQLKQRRVYRVAIGYAVAAWLMVQIAATVLPAFHAPEFILPVLILLLGIGFPVALVLAWAFDVTPSGIEKTPEGTGATAAKNLRYAWALGGIGLLVAVIGVGAYWWWHSPGAKSPDAKDDGRRSAASLPAPEKSIAVLPFENLSSDKENAYFAEGIQDEILTRLAKVGALKVISRTSTAHYASSPQNLPEIARQLGVANILEGSVQKAANAVHINVQLIRAATDEHLWAESYNRKLDDIFAVEGEVAGAIADQLKATLTGSEKQELNARPTNNTEAYEAYLRGLVFEGGIEDFSHSVLNSIKEFENAVRLDPDFALAWAHLCRQQGLVFLNLDQSPQRREAVRHALEMATKLGPNLPETELANGFYHYAVERDYEGAKTHYEAVRRAFPNNSVAPELLAGVARRQGHWEESRALYEQAIELDPQNVFLLTDAALGDLARRDAAAAQKHLARARDLNPKNTTVLSFLAASFQLSGDIARAQTFLDGLQPAEGDVILVSAIEENAILLRKYDSAIAMMKTQLEKPGELGTSLGSFENWFGDLQRHAGDAAAAAKAYQAAKHFYEEGLRAQPDNADFLNALGWSETFLGDKTAALNHVRQAIALNPSSKDAFLGPTYEDSLARIEAHFGDKDSAITALQHLLSIPYAAPPVTPALLRIDPDWDNLRGDPRFEKLCQEPAK